MKKYLVTLFLGFLSLSNSIAQNKVELNTGWLCQQAGKVKDNGSSLSQTATTLSGWMPAVVPGTVLTSLLHNKLIPDPFYGMNNERIPDIYKTGRDYYTYWFVKDFEQKQEKGQQFWLSFRGINYSCDVFLNGKKLNSSEHKGMFLRKTYNVSSLLAANGKNRLAVIVYPPDPVGNPNGGQGGDGVIARNVSHQYVAGWDWIQPIRDRNTGIWDKVYIEKTGSVKLKDPHLVTLVPGVRQPEGPQKPATLKLSATLENSGSVPVKGALEYELNGRLVSKQVELKPGNHEVSLPDFTIENPRLWWPHMYGRQELYNIKLRFVTRDKQESDFENISFGVREIQTSFNTKTESRQVFVNGQKIFIKGGNWIISDAMLRFSNERYDAEIRHHRDMNLNLIRIWGGALIERPEFYEACDKYGLLVFQDFWMSGDCNGRWLDPLKKEDQWTRRKYPDDHNLFLESAADMIKMVRNHPSLAMWCGGNEMTPPDDILVPLRDSLLPSLDGTRWFVDYSNSDSMSRNTIWGNGDGPYTIQPISKFWDYRTYPFNSEVGSVGVGDYESLERFIPQKNMIAPKYIPATTKNPKAEEIVDSVWDYHKYKGVGYEGFIEPYGTASDARDFAKKAQLVNYDQYRALMEGFSSHMNDWYTGVIIWKTQNPWTAMRGQMYDYYLDPNACLYGLRKGSEAVHVAYNPVDGMVTGINNSLKTYKNLMLQIKAYSMEGKDSLITQVFMGLEAGGTKKFLPVKDFVDKMAADKGMFLSVKLLDENKETISDNFYWLADKNGRYSGLNSLKKVKPVVTAKKLGAGKIQVTVSCPANGAVSFFNRVSVVHPQTRKRILPAFYSDNYISVIPGESRTLVVEYPEANDNVSPIISINGWNTSEQFIIPNP
ncbi:glycoside hydrolase family 2 protein [Desertivirga brevis]|uniref:glycoside hydrolase family 2 protein n=1 Tax=Desertivirga brevis TaxID=2810310 RepID=UPI001A9636CB|nr:glycoside hydrolase family 2 TIM barrel-domain containing protein [Pedobacter sp. SYSU D00873]